MIFFRFPFSETIYTVEETSFSEAVSFLSFDQSERINFEGRLKEISKTDFLNHEVFNDEQAILDYLNGTISDRYFKTKRRTDKNVKTAQEEVNKVVEEALGTNLFSQLNLNIED